MRSERGYFPGGPSLLPPNAKPFRRSADGEDKGKGMEPISSLNHVPTLPRDRKPEAGAKLGRDPQGEAARKRNRRHKPDDPDDEFEIDTFEHMDGEPQSR
jgi:hypothetical protein